MQITVEEILFDVRSLIDEYNIDGIVINESEVATIETNAIRYINQSVREAYKLSRVFKTKDIINKAVPNLLGDNYDVEQYTGTEQVYPKGGITGAKAYYFVVDGDFKAYIEEYDGTDWVTLESFDETMTEPTTYKGIITVSDASYPVRLRFAGSTYYEHKNRALYEYPFPASKIPDYEKYILVDMPDDFGELYKVDSEDNLSLYNEEIYKLEGFDKFYVLNDFEGRLKIRYIPVPVTATEKTDTITINNPLVQEFIIASVAAKVATSENPELVNYYEQKAKELEFKASKGQPAIEEETIDVYGITGDFDGYI